MNICVVCQYYPPDPFKIGSICEALVSRGHSVRVLTGVPNYPAGVVPEGYSHGQRRRETIGGVRVTRAGVIPRRKGKLGLLLNYASFVVTASLHALRIERDTDMIFVYQLSPVTMALPALIMKWKLNRPLLLYCLDLWPESMKILAPDEDTAAFRLTRRLSRFIYRSCDAIAISSPTFSDYLVREHAIDPSLVSYLPQHADDVGRSAFMAEPDAPSRFVFAGNIGMTQGIEQILEAVEMLSVADTFEVHFVGDGSYLETARRLVSDRGLTGQVVFHGRHPAERMGEFLAMADACLLTLKSENLTGLTVPGKLQTYLAAGRPVIGAIDGPARDVIEEARCGLCVPSGDVAGLARAMREFMASRDRWTEWGSNARRYYETHYTFERFISTLEQTMTDLMGLR